MSFPSCRVGRLIGTFIRLQTVESAIHTAMWGILDGLNTVVPSMITHPKRRLRSPLKNICHCAI